MRSGKKELPIFPNLSRPQPTFFPQDTSSPPQTLTPGPHLLKLYTASRTIVPTTYDLGPAHLDFPLANPPTPSYPDTFAPLPEITHTFRPDQRMPPKILSMVFSGLVLVPWVLFVILVRTHTHHQLIQFTYSFVLFSDCCSTSALTHHSPAPHSHPSPSSRP